MIFQTHGFSQSVTLTGPDNLEVGIAGTFTASFTPPAGTTVLRYEWFAAFCDAGIAGSSGIYGSINGGFNNTWIDYTANLTSTADFVYGDFSNNVISDQISVVVYYEVDSSGHQENRPGYKNINIYRVYPPKIQGSDTIQKCCTKPFTLMANGYGDADVFEWYINGNATILSGQYTNTITIQPPSTGNFTVGCEVSRLSGLYQYYRSNEITITRFNPVTSAISGPDYFWKGENSTLCLTPVCGQTGANWIIPSTLDIVSGAGTNCIVLTPKASTPDGATAIISARAVISGGCLATPSPSSSYKIYSNAAPPVPQGYITLDLDNNEPCIDPVYIVNWHPTSPFVNGYTSVSPGIILGGGHHNKPRLIRVCNWNLCSGQNSCISFYVTPPPPCEEIVQNGGNKKGEGQTSFKDNASLTFKAPPDFTIYPNPSTGRFSINLIGEGDNGTLIIYDAQGRPLHMFALDSIDKNQVFPQSGLPKGLYFVQIRTNSANITKKIVVL